MFSKLIYRILIAISSIYELCLTTKFDIPYEFSSIRFRIIEFNFRVLIPRFEVKLQIVKEGKN